MITKNTFILCIGFTIISFLPTCKQTGEHPHQSNQSEETKKMVQELASLVQDGDPFLHLHWNHRRAELLKTQMKKTEELEVQNIWFTYCQELLYAGESQACISELETYLNKQNRSYQKLLDENTQEIFELLALAYLRLGEQENCQNFHTPSSCILPLQPKGQHQLTQGSQKAIELYSLLQDVFPNEKYKWLINLAYMTLGQHPEEVPEKYLINFPNDTLEQKHFPAFQEIAINLGVAVDGLSGGVCVDDFNNDGLLDIFTTSYGMQDQVKLYFNNGEGGFKDVTIEAGLYGIVSGLNCIHADYDNDGFIDILVLRGAWLGKGGNQPNSLLKNMGDGTFADVTRSSGILSYHPTQTASWADFNRDGYLDLFIGNESLYNQSHPCELYQNNGDGTFSEVASAHGLDQLMVYAKGVSWGDINNDQWPDLFISVLGDRNLLFKNVEGNFVDISSKGGIQKPYFSFPCWFWDVNNDGLLDIYVSGYDVRNYNDLAGEYAKEIQSKNVYSEKPQLFLNQGDETFTEVSTDYGISRTMYSMGSNYGDLDNDGFLDFYVGTGAPDFSTLVPNRMFRNVNGEKFEEVTSAGNFGHIQKGHGTAFADFDCDGDQDIYMVLGGAYEGDTFTNILYENPISNNNWIVIELEGKQTNHKAIGTKIEVLLPNGQRLFRTVGTGGSFGASSLQQEIGLGDVNHIQEITVHWQNTSQQVFADIAVNQKINIQEGVDEIKIMDYQYIPFNKHKVHMHH